MVFVEDVKQLSVMFGNKDWFHDVSTDSHGRYVVYANYINLDILSNVPATLNGRQVLLHFAAHAKAKREQFVNNVSLYKLNYNLPINTTPAVMACSPTEELEILDLQHDFEDLEEVCGAYTLQDIFYERHDLDNAITNWSKQYPEVRKRMNELYDQYGFDVLYDEFEKWDI